MYVYGGIPLPLYMRDNYVHLYIIISYVDIILLHVDLNNSHVNLIMIIALCHLSCICIGGRSMPLSHAIRSLF